MLDHALTIRAATPSDHAALGWLAALDSRSPIRDRTLVAERAGIAVAAIALTAGAVVNNPLQASAEAVDMLRRRRYQLLRQGGDVAPLRSLVRRLAPQPFRAV